MKNKTVKRIVSIIIAFAMLFALLPTSMVAMAVVWLDNLYDALCRFESLNPDAYTEYSYALVTEVYLTGTKALIEVENYTQEEIDTIADELNNAIDNLLMPMMVVRSDTGINGFGVWDDDDLLEMADGGVCTDVACFEDGDDGPEICIISTASTEAPDYGWSRFISAVDNGTGGYEAVKNPFGADLSDTAGLCFYIKYEGEYQPAGIRIGVGVSGGPHFVAVNPGVIFPQEPNREGGVCVVWSEFYDEENDEDIYDYLKQLEYFELCLSDSYQEQICISNLYAFEWSYYYDDEPCEYGGYHRWVEIDRDYQYGSITFDCVKCNSQLVCELPACDHEWGEWEVAKEPNCSEEGEQARICARCGEVESAAIPVEPEAHDWVEIGRTPATCTEKGVINYACSINPDHTKDEEIDIDPEAHDWGEWTETKPATCTAKGEEERVCTNDASHVEVRVTETTGGHYWSEWVETKAATCTEEGEKTRLCLKCGEIETKAIPIDPEGHNWSEWEIIKEPTCGEYGEITRHCVFCDETETVITEIDSVEHDWNEWIVTKSANCKEKGEKYRTCRICGKKEIDEIPIDSSVHNWGEWEESSGGICEYVKRCLYCGEQTFKVYEGSYSHKYALENGLFFEIAGRIPMKGDSDDDESITVADALSALRIAARLVNPSYKSIACCDIDVDGSVTVADALAILRVAARLTQPFDMYYTITWKNYNGEVIRSDRVAKGEMPSFAGVTPSRESDAVYSYTFAGWSPEIEIATRDTTYLAQYSQETHYSYSISYDANGGTGAPVSQTKFNGRPIILSSVVPQNVGYGFVGWACAADGKIYQSASTFDLDSDVTLFAVWDRDACANCHGAGGFDHLCSNCDGEGSITTPASTSTCIVCYGTGYDGYTTEVCTACQGLGGTMTWVCDNNNCRSYGWPQTFYYVQSSSEIGKCIGCGKSYGHYTDRSPCSRCGATGMVRVQRVCFYCNGRGYTYIPATTTTCDVCNGKGVITNICNSCSGKKYYSFYNLTLINNGANVGSVSVPFYGPFKLTVPSRSGYSFDGWYDAPNGGKRYTDADGLSVSSYTDAGNKTLYAHWRLNYYSISYQLENGDDISLFNCPTVYSVENGDINLPRQVKDNYELCWTINGEKVTKIDASLVNDVVVIGAWQKTTA